MGAWMTEDCPVQGCGYTARARLPMGDEAYPFTGFSKESLRKEHPNHPGAQPPSTSTTER